MTVGRGPFGLKYESTSGRACMRAASCIRFTKAKHTVHQCEKHAVYQSDARPVPRWTWAPSLRPLPRCTCRLARLPSRVASLWSLCSGGSREPTFPPRLDECGAPETDSSRLQGPPSSALPMHSPNPRPPAVPDPQQRILQIRPGGAAWPGVFGTATQKLSERNKPARTPSSTTGAFVCL